jgi:hypothetical protein
VIAILSSCGQKKVATNEIGELTNYSDATAKFEIKYPKYWITVKNPGVRFIAYSSDEARTEFLNITNMEAQTQEIPASRIEFLTLKVEAGKSYEETINTGARMYQSNLYSAAEPVTIDGVQGSKQKYSFEFGSSSKLEGEIYIATKDSQVVNVIIFEEIGGNFDKSKAKYQEILLSAKLAVKSAAPAKSNETAKLKEAPGPSDKFVAASGEGFSVQIPDNFKLAKSSTKGAEKSFMISGERRGDCTASIDIVDPKGASLEKIAEAYAAKLGASSKTSIGGITAYMFNVKTKADLDSKLYILMNNNKQYKIFVNYYKPEATSYKPAFDKIIKSIKFK